MRLLIVGFADSVHVARYLQLLGGSGVEVQLFDSQAWSRPHPELPDVELHAVEQDYVDSFEQRAERLAETLDAFAPDLVHSHEIQRGGALVDAARALRGGLPAPWLVTNWGSDILWFGRDAAYRPRISSVMAHCDYYGAECHRDVALARAFGFRGEVVGVWPVAGGIDLEDAVRLRAPGSTSARRAIAVKGALRTFGVADVALAAIDRCGDLLGGWELCGYQMEEESDARARELAETHGMRYTRLSRVDARDLPHDDLLAMHGRARVSLALNRSDALSTSFLESLAMGAFPVQSSSSCGREITPPGRGALFVPFADVDAVAAALRRALTDDALVDGAAAINARAVAEHLDRRRTRARVLDAYERIMADTRMELFS